VSLGAAFYIAKLPGNLIQGEWCEGTVECQADLRALQSGQAAGGHSGHLQA